MNFDLIGLAKAIHAQPKTVKLWYLTTGFYGEILDWTWNHETPCFGDEQIIAFAVVKK